MTEISMVQNDTSPSLELGLVRPDNDGVNQVINLTGATVKMKILDTNTRIQTNDGHDQATITEAAQGEVQYDFSSDDLPNPGIYLVDVEITYNTGKVETQPEQVMIRVREEV